MNLHNKPSRRSVLKNALVLGAALAAPTVLHRRAFSAGTQTVQMQLGWLINAYHVGDIVAKQNGYFEEAGLNVNFAPGGPTVDGIAIVAAGGAEIGQTSSSPVLLHATSQQIPIKAFAVGAQRHPFAYFSQGAKPIRTPADLIGKKIGIPPTSLATHRPFLRRNNIDEDSMEVVVTGSDKTPLLTGQVDTITSWTTDLGALSTLADLVTMPIADNGLSMYALIYYSAAETFGNDATLLEKFLTGAARGWEFTRAQPEEAVTLMVKEYSNLDPEKTLAGVKAILPCEFNEQTLANGWGTFDPAEWQEQISLFDELGEFSEAKPNLEDVMSTAILDATADVRPKLAAK